jgi:hypothetical protein
MNSYKNGFWYILGDFFANSSGHPGSIALKKKNVLYIQTKRIRRADRISADQDCQIKPKIPFLVNF